LRYAAGGRLGVTLTGSGPTVCAGPGASLALPRRLHLSRIFDLSVPGSYEVQLAGEGPFFTASPAHGGRIERHLTGRLLVSNVIKVRVLAPATEPPGPILKIAAIGTTRSAIWGMAEDGVEMAAQARPSAGLTARVRLLFRCTGRRPAGLRLTGNPPIDFLGGCDVRGPFVGPGYVNLPAYKRIIGKPAPLTAYGRQLSRPAGASPPEKMFTLKPGKVYEYWVPLVLNSWFDLSYKGVYRFKARLGGTHLNSAPIPLFIGVPPAEYKRPGDLFRVVPPRWARR
jgi:hypothetical protein